MPFMFPTICLGCKRLDRNFKIQLRCEAFPEGVPRDIAAGLLDHTEPVDGDHGMMFLEDPDRRDEVATFYDWYNSPQGEMYRQVLVDEA